MAQNYTVTEEYRDDGTAFAEFSIDEIQIAEFQWNGVNFILPARPQQIINDLPSLYDVLMDLQSWVNDINKRYDIIASAPFGSSFSLEINAIPNPAVFELTINGVTTEIKINKVAETLTFETRAQFILSPSEFILHLFALKQFIEWLGFTGRKFSFSEQYHRFY